MTTSVSVAELAQDIEGFLAFKRALGYAYHRGEFTLRCFRRFVEQRSAKRAKVDLEPLLKEWVGRIDGRKAVSVGLEFGVVRQLCLYRRRRHPHSFVPDHGWAPVKEAPFLPYIFSREEIRRLPACGGQASVAAIAGQRCCAP